MTVLLLLAAVAAIQMTHYYPLLPERLAVHFGSSGEPDGWSSKGEFMVLFGAMEAFFVLFGVAFAILLDRVPLALINIPHKHYWFSPEKIAFVAAILWFSLRIVLRFRAPRERALL
jgi:hypothetical protein